MATKEQLRAKIAPLRAEIDRIEKEERAVEHAALIGKCFKYRNSHGGDERWWLYLRVTRADEYWPRALKFEEDSRGGIRIEPDAQFLNGDSYHEIGPMEFNAAWNALKAKVAGMA